MPARFSRRIQQSCICVYMAASRPLVRSRRCTTPSSMSPFGQAPARRALFSAPCLRTIPALSAPHPASLTDLLPVHLRPGECCRMAPAPIRFHPERCGVLDFKIVKKGCFALPARRRCRLVLSHPKLRLSHEAARPAKAVGNSKLKLFDSKRHNGSAISSSTVRPSWSSLTETPRKQDLLASSPRFSGSQRGTKSLSRVSTLL